MPTERKVILSVISGVAAYATGVLAVLLVAVGSDFQYMALPLFISLLMPLKIIPAWLFIVLPCALIFSERAMLWQPRYAFVLGGIVGFCVMFPPWRIGDAMQGAYSGTYGRAMFTIYAIPAFVVGACCFGYYAVLLKCTDKKTKA